MRHFPPNHRNLSAFTLIEILIVVVILGILASIVIPQFSNASHLARENTLKDELRYLRTQVQVYKAQHQDTPPGYPNGNLAATPTADAFAEQMTLYTDEFGDVSTTEDAGHKLHYLSRMPANPVNGLNTVLLLSESEDFTADDTTGWIYKPATGMVRANITGSDNNETPYIDY